ncbi:MAG: cytochrome c family protein [Deltaproteobacteria bacterium]|nr:cytochrome c family protein [Deltaproteobacteria bacterium]
MNLALNRQATFKNIAAGLLSLVVLMIAGMAYAQVTPLTDADVEKMKKAFTGPASAEQPILFSHRIHAGQDKIDCQYCHIYARRSQSSGVPPVAICQGCHKLIATNLAEVQKMLKYWEEQKPIPWVKIHDVPDFVRFTHEKHVGANNEVYPEGIPCQDCHGPIETMDVVVKQNPAFGQMGWCLECHITIPGTQERKRAIAATLTSLEVKNYKHPSGDYGRPILSDCLTCHY